MADHRYHRGKIYAIRSHQTDLVYIGSTISRLSERLFKHKSDLKRYITGRYHYVSSCEITKFEDCFIELIEEYRCNSRDELNRREGQVIRETPNCVNRNVSGRTRAEYRQDNKAKIKQYYLDNKQAISNYKNQKHNCPCGGKFTTSNKSVHQKTKKHKAYLEALE